MEDPDLLVDLRELNSNQSDRYKVFRKECDSYLQECTAVHERRHDSATYLTKALSVRDLVEQVSKKCPPGTPIPSQEWVRLQFCPRNPRTKTAALYRKRLPVKMAVGVMRKEMPAEAEKVLKNCNSIKQIRSAGGSVKAEIAESVKAPVDLLSDIMRRLELNGKKFEVEMACSENELELFWEILLQIESSLSPDDTTRDKVKDKVSLQEFISHCCQLRHYTF